MRASIVHTLPGQNLLRALALTLCLLLLGACSGGAAPAPTLAPVPVNAAPVAVDDADTVRARSLNQLLNVLANDTDADGDPLSIVAASISASSPLSSGGAVSVAPGAGILSYSPPPIFIGQQVISYTVGDGRGGLGHGTVTVTVTALPIPPLARPDAFVVLSDSAGNSLDVLLNDVARFGGGSLTLTAVNSLSTVPAGAVSGISIVGNRVQYTPAAGFAGVETLRYTIRDSKGATASSTALITVLPVGAVGVPPVALPDVATIAVGSSNQLIDVIANDVDLAGGGLTLTDVTALATVPAGSNGGIGITDNQVSYTPPSAIFIGLQMASYTVRGVNGQTATGLLTILVAPVGLPVLPPLAVPDILTVAADSLNNVIAALDNDIDASATGLTITDVSVALTVPAAAGASASTDGNSVLFTPPAGYFGVVTLQYSVQDGNGATSTAAIIISVLPVALPPVALPDVAVVAQDAAATDIAVLANDVDFSGGGLSLTAASVTSSLPAAAHTVAISTDQVRFTPAAGFAGIVVIAYTATDVNGGAAAGVLSIVVSPLVLALPPVALPDVATVTQDAAASDIAVLANDVDLAGGGLSLTAASVTSSLPAAAHTVAINGDQVQFTPAAGFAGAVVIAYTATDINGSTAAGVLSIVVSPLVPPLPPVAVPDAAVISSAAGAAQINVLANDIDPAGGGLTLTAASVVLAVPASPGAVSIVANQIQFSPSLLYVGAVTISYTVADINGNTAIGALTLTVLP